MLTFPTHFLVGGALSYLFGFSILWGAIGGLFPDLDYFTPWHRGPYHSFAAAIVTAVLIYVFTRSRKKSFGVAIGFAAHSAADWFNQLGVMFFWPVSAATFAIDTIAWDDPVANSLLSLVSLSAILLLMKRRKKLTWREMFNRFSRKLGARG
jgi:membrane-bound metal-dependent hydrolase YbcI (DUF457 family)